MPFLPSNLEHWEKQSLTFWLLQYEKIQEDDWNELSEPVCTPAMLPFLVLSQFIWFLCYLKCMHPVVNIHYFGGSLEEPEYPIKEVRV